MSTPAYPSTITFVNEEGGEEERWTCFNCFLPEEIYVDNPLGETKWSELQAAYPGLLRASVFFRDYNEANWVTEAERDRCLRYQEIHQKAFIQQEPYLLLFISHRWETPEHPDPTGRQFRAVASLLEIVNLLLVDYAQLGYFRELKRPKHTLIEGVAQAHQIMNQYLCALYDRDGGDDAVCVNDFNPDVAFERIGVFYDFMSLPQKPRTPAEDVVFRTGLEHFTFLARASTVIPLRFPDDQYDERAWCALEIEAGNHNSGRDFSRGRQNTRFSTSFHPERMHAPLVELEQLKRLDDDLAGKLVRDIEHADFRWMSAENAEDSMQAISAMCQMYHSIVNTLNARKALGELSSDTNSRTLGYAMAQITIQVLIFWLSLQADTEIRLINIVGPIMNDAGMSTTNGADLLFVALTCLSSHRFGLLKEFAVICLESFCRCGDSSCFSVVFRPVDVVPCEEETKWWGSTADGESKFVKNFIGDVLLVTDPEFLSEKQRSFITKVKQALAFGVPEVDLLEP